MESVRRMICSVKDNLLLSQCNIGNTLPRFSLSCSPGERWREASWCFSFFFLFLFVAGKPSQPKNVHIHPWSVRPALRRLDAAGTVICSFRKQLHNAELLLFVSVECCTDVTVILYYLAHCRDVIWMVCALHSNWQLCGKDTLLFVLGNINSHQV